MIHELVQRVHFGHWPADSVPETAVTAAAPLR